jgi:hypothetical protein
MKRLDMHKQTVIAFVCVAALAVLPSAAANFPVGTHLIKGTLKDWQNKVLNSSAAVTIQAVSTNGSIIASTKVAVTQLKTVEDDSKAWSLFLVNRHEVRTQCLILPEKK